jgi:hypothetical protein
LLSVRVGPGVGYDPGRILQDRRGAQTRGTVGLFGVDGVVGLEPDLLAVDEADDRDRHPEDARGDPGHTVEGTVGSLVEDPVPANSRKPLLLVRRHRARICRRNGGAS